jgi:hypothetical protein
MLAAGLGQPDALPKRPGSFLAMLRGTSIVGVPRRAVAWRGGDHRHCHSLLRERPPRLDLRPVEHRVRWWNPRFVDVVA